MMLYLSQQVAVLGNCDEEMSDMAYDYGRNIGISFQVIYPAIFEP